MAQKIAEHEAIETNDRVPNRLNRPAVDDAADDEGDSGWQYTIAKSGEDLLALDTNLEDKEYRSKFVEYMWSQVKHVPDGKGVVLRAMDLLAESRCQMSCSWSGVSRTANEQVDGVDKRKTMFARFTNIVRTIHQIAVRKTPTQSTSVSQSRKVYCLNNAKRRSTLKGNVPSGRSGTRSVKRKRRRSGADEEALEPSVDLDASDIEQAKDVQAANAEPVVTANI